jgi:hypothetical protein
MLGISGGPDRWAPIRQAIVTKVYLPGVRPHCGGLPGSTPLRLRRKARRRYADCPSSRGDAECPQGTALAPAHGGSRFAQAGWCQVGGPVGPVGFHLLASPRRRHRLRRPCRAEGPTSERGCRQLPADQPNREVSPDHPRADTCKRQRHRPTRVKGALCAGCAAGPVDGRYQPPLHNHQHIKG